MEKMTVFAFALLAGLSYGGGVAAENGVAEFCADFGKDPSEYALHLTKNISLPPDADWKYPESVKVPRGQVAPDWHESVTLEAPFDDTDDDSRLPGGCFSANFGSSATREIKNPKIDVVTLDPADGNAFQFHLRNAKETLGVHYGKKFKASWKASLEDFEYSKDFEAVITGPCAGEWAANARVMVEYCVDGSSLHLVRETDYIQKYLFLVADESDYWDEGSEYSYSASIDFGNGQYVPVKEMIRPGCSEPAFATRFNLPKAYKKSAAQKSLYGKTLPVKLNAKIRDGENEAAGEIQFNIHVNDTCK